MRLQGESARFRRVERGRGARGGYYVCVDARCARASCVLLRVWNRLCARYVLVHLFLHVVRLYCGAVRAAS